MREVLSIHVGGFGNCMAVNYWDQMCDEHRIRYDGTYGGDDDKYVQYSSVSFDERIEERFIPRSLHFDTDPHSLDSIRNSSMGKLFRPDNFVSAQGGTGGNFAAGYYRQGADIIDECMDKVRNQVEACDSIEAFQFIHSVSGGGGSGFCSLLIDKINEEYNNLVSQYFTLFPNDKQPHNILEPYNMILSLRQLGDKLSMVHVMDNYALEESIKYRHPKLNYEFNELNTLVSIAMSDSTCGMRFPGQLNFGLRKMVTNLIPFPRLHFFVDTIASLPQSSYPVTKELFLNMLDQRNQLGSVKIKHGRNLTSLAMFRGSFSSEQVESWALRYQERSSSYFVEWIPNNISTALCSTPGNKRSQSVYHINSSTAVKEVFQSGADKFSKLIRGKAYLHWFTSIGMDEMEFTEAESNCNDLMNEFPNFYNNVVEDEFEDDENAMVD